MKLRDIATGKRSVKNVPFRVSNAAPVQGDDWQKEEGTIQVGIRGLLPREAKEVFAKAQESALAAGAKEWLATHPLCELHLMVHLVAVGCVDSEAPSEPFFVGGAAEILDSPEVAGDNLAYLAQQVKLHNDGLSPADADLTPEQLVSALLREAERPENAPEAFFSRLRPSSQLNYFRSSAKLLSDLLTSVSLFGSQGTTSSTATTVPDPASSP